VRRYLQAELNQINYKLEKNTKRVIDDFCLLVLVVSTIGLIGFDVASGLDSLVYLYKRTIPFQSDFLVYGNGKLNIPHFITVTREIGRIEEVYLKNQVRLKIYDNQAGDFINMTKL
jgi:5'-3' exonuclease